VFTLLRQRGGECESYVSGLNQGELDANYRPAQDEEMRGVISFELVNAVILCSEHRTSCNRARLRRDLLSMGTLPLPCYSRR